MKILFARHDIAVVMMPQCIHICAVGPMPDDERADKYRIAMKTAAQYMAERCSVKPNTETWTALVEEVRAAWRLEA